MEYTDGVSNEKSRVLELFGTVRLKLLDRTDGPSMISVSE